MPVNISCAVYEVQELVFENVIYLDQWFLNMRHMAPMGEKNNFGQGSNF